MCWRVASVLTGGRCFSQNSATFANAMYQSGLAAAATLMLCYTKIILCIEMEERALWQLKRVKTRKKTWFAVIYVQPRSGSGKTGWNSICTRCIRQQRLQKKAIRPTPPRLPARFRPGSALGRRRNAFSRRAASSFFHETASGLARESAPSAAWMVCNSGTMPRPARGRLICAAGASRWFMSVRLERSNCPAANSIFLQIGSTPTALTRGNPGVIQRICCAIIFELI